MSGTDMTIFCIQIQPDRAPALDIAQVRELCLQLAENKTVIARHGVVEGDDEGPYLNLMFEIIDPIAFWRLFSTRIYDDALVGPGMKAASMATCTGEDEWEDYLLLYHYDKKMELDSLDEQ